MEKLYYTLAEVAAMFRIPDSTLRYWEKEFPQLRPRQTGGGIRQYRKEDIEQVRLIHHLLKEKGMTVQGARQRLRQNPTTAARNVEVITRLKEIREELTRMKHQLDYIN